MMLEDPFRHLSPEDQEAMIAKNLLDKNGENEKQVKPQVISSDLFNSNMLLSTLFQDEIEEGM